MSKGVAKSAVAATAIVALLAGCSEGRPGDGSGSSGSNTDGDDRPDAYVPGFPAEDANTGGGGGGGGGSTVDEHGQYPFFSEVMAQPFDGVGSNRAEYVEIWNPTAITFELGDFYLATSQSYALLPAGDTYLDFQQDFIVRFPAGARLGPRETAVVAIDGEGFEEAYDASADYALRNPGEVASTMLVVEMDNADQIGISGNGEAVVLFHWDGNSNLVQDLDMMISGIREDEDHPNNILDKTGLEVDGPVPGVAIYNPDAATMARAENQFEAEAVAGHSYTRIDLPGEHIIQEDGNGLTGHDVTSEDVRASWESFPEGDLYSAPNPGEIAPELAQAADDALGD